MNSKTPSDPFLFSGYKHRALLLSHGSSEPVTFHLEVDREGNGSWSTLREIIAAPGIATFTSFDSKERGAWIRLAADRDLASATHNLLIQDYCSYRGLFIVSGVATSATRADSHVIRSDDGKTALWAGAIDDVWKLEKPRGQGGPWQHTAVKALTFSDPYLMTAYDRKSLMLEVDRATTITAEIDLTGDGRWTAYQKFALQPGKPVSHVFPEAFSAYWIRFAADKDVTASAQLDYQ